MHALLTATSLLLLLAGTTHAAEDKLVLTGSSTVAPLVSELAKSFEKAHPGTRIDVQTGGSSRGVTDARTGVAHIGMVSRALKADEADLTASTIAMDGVAMIVHKTNPVQELTDAQIVAIYTGKTTNWKEVGGPDAAITVVNKAEGRSTLELFTAYTKVDVKAIKASIVIGDNAHGIKTVAGNPHAIGYVSIGTADYEATHGTAIKLLPLGGKAASVATVKDGTFPMSRPLNLVTKGAPTGLAKQFIDYARSAAAETAVKEQFFVPMTKPAT